ncbi:MAG: hypothetical protein NVSMB22_18640 [Chloroflexota bacterium]
MEGVATRTFGALLRRYRAERGLTQEELAERAGLSVRGISDLERGVNRVPYQSTIARLIEALTLSAEAASVLEAAGSRRRGPTAPGTALPVALTSFVGRERDLASAGELVRESRLVTLTGVGGSGKTRLALELAAQLQAEYPGIAVVELAPVADQAFIGQVIAQAIGLVGNARSSTDVSLVLALKESEMLLVLDNCEHLIEGCASLVESLLKACPGLRILTTSREPLGVPGEVTYSVPPLTVPSLEPVPVASHLERFGAVRLFVDRAAAAIPGFTLDDDNAPAVVRLCSRLDGLPLAIELAAARTRSVSLDDILDRLDNRFVLLSRGARTAAPRHQTLRATIDWSHELLTEDERTLFRRLAVFAGGWTLEDAESVCAGDRLPRNAIFDVHARLADKSLTVAEPPAVGPSRHRFLETVRQYAAERLAEAGELDLLRQRHFAHCLERAERYHDAAGSGGSDASLLALAAHRDNFRTALAWAAELDPIGGLRLASALDDFWRMLSAAEGWSWLQLMLVAVPQGNPHRLRALLTAGMLSAYVSAFAEGTSMLREARTMAQQAGDRAGEAWALLWLGRLAAMAEDVDSAEEYLQAALALHDELDIPLGRVRSLTMLGFLQAVILARRAEGDQKLRAAVDLAHGLEDSWGEGFAHMMFSISAADAGDLERTRLHARMALRTPSLGPLLGVVLHQLGRATLAKDPASALRLMGAATGHLQRTGTVLPAFLQRRADTARERATQLLGQQNAMQRFEEGRKMTTEEAIRLYA